MADLWSELKRVKAAMKSATSTDPAKPLEESKPVAPAPSAAGRPALRPNVARSTTGAGTTARSAVASPDKPARQVQIVKREATDVVVTRTRAPAAPASASIPTRVVRAPMPDMPVATRPVGKKFHSLAKGQLTRKMLFKTPAAWLARGAETQLVSATNRGSGGVDVVIGIDFGTSYTKAAVGLMDKIFPVTWEGVSSISPSYLLPSEYSSLETGDLVLGQHPDATVEQVQGDLKLPFLNVGVSDELIAKASVFLALVIRYVRAWVYHHHGGKLGNRTIRWQVNLGAPSDGLESVRIEDAYRMLAATAWIRSLEPNLRDLPGTDVKNWRERPALASMDLMGCLVFPEFVAQMAGYMQSPQKQRGLHALIDVGGGTLDIATFNVHAVEGDDTFPFLVPQVHPLGTHGLLQNRYFGVAPEVKTKPVDELNPIDSPPGFSLTSGIDLDHIKMRDDIFSTELRDVVRSVFELTKSRRYRLSDAWNTGIRTFFTGGGSHVPLYSEAVLSARIPGRGGLKLMPLPLHPRLDDFRGQVEEYQRISVACGLAQDAFTLGRVVRAREVEDDREITRVGNSRPDRDELYAR